MGKYNELELNQRIEESAMWNNKTRSWKNSGYAFGK